MSLLYPLNFNQGTEMLHAEAANGEFNLDKKTETHVKQDIGGKKPQKWEAAGDLALVPSFHRHLSHYHKTHDFGQNFLSVSELWLPHL